MKQIPSKSSGNQQDAIHRLKGLMNRVVINSSPEDRQATEKIDLTAALEQMPLEELQQLVENLRIDLEKVVDFVREQEEELTSQTQKLAELKAKLKTVEETERFRLAVELANEQERKEMLEATLLGQRRNIRKREALFNQHWQILRRRQGIFKADEYGQQIDLKPVLRPKQEVPTSLEEELAKPNFTRSRKKLVLLCAGILAASGILFYGFKLTRPQGTDSATTQTESQFPDSVAALGYLEPQGEIIKLSAPASIEGIRVERLLVKRGDRIKAGQDIAVLDNHSRLQASLQQAKSQVTVAQARLQQIQAGAKQGDIQAQAARFQRSKAELEGQIISQKANIGSLEAQLEGEKSAGQASVERIEAELTNAQKDCERYQNLYEEGAISDSDRDRICLEEATTRKSLQEAQANLNRAVSSLQNQIDEAKANLSRTVATLERQIKEEGAMLGSVAEVRSVDVQIAKAELQSAQAAVQRAQADLDLAYVRSPQNGQILNIYTRPGEVIGDKGIVDLGQTEQMYVTAEVYETDISRVRLGQPAMIKSDGVVGDLRGTVDEIGLQIGRKDVLGTDPVADTDARVVDVKIRLDSEDSYRVANLTNLQVNVIINTANSQANMTQPGRVEKGSSEDKL